MNKNNYKLYYAASILIGMLFSVNSILVPRIYGDTLNSAIYSKEASMINLILISIFQLIFVILSNWVNLNFRISTTQYLRNNLLEINLKRDNAPSSNKKIESFIAKFIPDIVELRYRSIINIFSTLTILIFSVFFLFKIHLYFAVIIFFFNIVSTFPLQETS